jgi:uncharacterized membrane protein
MKTKFLISLLFPLFPLCYLGYQWNRINEIVPLHFNLNMTPDRFGPKSELLTNTIIFGVISILLVLLSKFLPKKDTQENLKNQVGLLENITLGISVFFTIIGFFMIQTAMSAEEKLIMNYFPMIFLLFVAFLGNYMISIKQNQFIGIRTPWTLASESVWRKTHQFAGKLFFYSSLVGIITLFFISDFSTKMIFTLVLLVIMLTISTYYSYKIYKKESLI